MFVWTEHDPPSLTIETIVDTGDFTIIPLTLAEKPGTLILGRLDAELVNTASTEFDNMWNLRPFSSYSVYLPDDEEVPNIFQPYVDWLEEVLDKRLDEITVIWLDSDDSIHTDLGRDAGTDHQIGVFTITFTDEDQRPNDSDVADRVFVLTKSGKSSDFDRYAFYSKVRVAMDHGSIIGVGGSGSDDVYRHNILTSSDENLVTKAIIVRFRRQDK